MNHWGGVANFRWKLIVDKKYKNQQTVNGFANWTDFYPINSTEKIFFIEVNFKDEIAKIQSKKERNKIKLLKITPAAVFYRRYSYF